VYGPRSRPAWRRLKAEPGIRWDLRDLQRLDHLGAQALWNHWGHQWPAQLEVLPDQRAMLERVARFAVVPPPYRRRTLWEYFLGLGESRVMDPGGMCRGICTASAPRRCRSPRWSVS
jgi:hypothetical protein